jgi:putative oxidoreductase
VVVIDDVMFQFALLSGVMANMPGNIPWDRLVYIVAASRSGSTHSFRESLSMTRLTDMLRSDGSVSQALLRITLGAVLLPHGAQHAFGLLGGYGFRETLSWMTHVLGIPAPLAAVGIVVEVAGPIALILGVGSRAAGLALVIFMATAATTHAGNGFFMNWFGTQRAGVEGYEYHLLTIAMGLTVAARGAGALSLDRWLTSTVRRTAEVTFR